MGNTAILDNNLVVDIAQQLNIRLPSGWEVTAGISSEGRSLIDATLIIRAPDGVASTVLVAAKQRLEPKDVDHIAITRPPQVDQPLLVAAPFLSPRAQERLSRSGYAYADLTGNIRLALIKPGLVIQTTGATQNPEPTPRDRKSLKGPKAGRLIRALSDFRPPLGLRELAKRAGVDAGYASRVVEFLNREALVVRATRGPITAVDWSALLRRWSQEYTPMERRRVAMYLAPRGLASVIEKLRAMSGDYVVSGSWAASQFAPVAATRLLLLYANRPTAIARDLEIKPTDAGANIALATPFDPVVFERTSKKNGITVAALSQVAADLMTSPGRGPNEAEALMAWMSEHENVWRA